MAVYIKKGKELVASQVGMSIKSAFYLGSRLIWQSIRSCFGAGHWVNEKPWINTEGWKNN